MEFIDWLLIEEKTDKIIGQRNGVDWCPKPGETITFNNADWKVTKVVINAPNKCYLEEK